MKALAAILLLAGMACTGPADESRTIVASVYPLAWAAEEIAGPGWEVIDLTPPGAEAHDIELTLEQRSQIEDADVILYLGDIGFQPEVENVVADVDGRVVTATQGMSLLRAEADHPEDEGDEGEPALDPHVWLDPVRFLEIADRIRTAISDTEPGGGIDGVADAIGALDERYVDGLEQCRYDTLVVSHEAFGYLTERYGLSQAGLADLTPEAEPTVEALGEAGAAFESGRAGAVFYEIDAEARSVAETVAGDAGVPALPLNTLESRPADGGYISVMEENLASLREGLECE